MSTIRVAIVGGGPNSMMGPVHLSAMRTTGQFKLVAGVFSTNKKKSIEHGRQLGLDEKYIYDNFKALASHAYVLSLDAVVILTPNNSHIEVASEFANKGVHIICEKPLGVDLNGVEQLNKFLLANRLSFVLAHPYSAYKVVRQAKQQIVEGILGDIKLVSVEYLQGWLSELLENDVSNHGAVWRENPETGGLGGVLGDIGTHAFQLLEYLTGTQVTKVAADVTASPGRAVPDDARMMLKLSNGAKGSLWCSQVAIGSLNSLSIHIIGTQGSLKWRQEDPEAIHLFDRDNNEIVYHRGQSGEGTLPPGHPEGYHEGFVQIYNDASKQIREFNAEKECSVDSPGLEAGIRGMKFINAALKSSQNDSVWTTL